MRVQDVGVVTPEEARLTVPKDQADLPAHAADTALAFIDILGSESPGGKGYWRLVELYSIDELPFAVRLQWTGGGGPILLTASRATRVCIYASAVKVRGCSLSDAAINRVGCQVSDILTPLATANVFEQSFLGGGIAGGDPVTFPVVPYALRVRVDSGTLQGLAGTTVELLDGNGNVMCMFMANTQPSDGVSVASAAAVRVTPPAGVRSRISFHLSV